MTTYIMPQTQFNQLCSVHAFTAMNGDTYQKHILLIAGKRIPDHLHEDIKNAKSGEDALAILTQNNVPWTHIYG